MCGIVITFFLEHITFFLLFSLHSQIILYVLVSVFERERESGLSPLGLSVSLIKDRRLMERECVARLACRPRQQHTTLAVWRERANGGGGVKKRKELDESWRKMQLLKFIFVLVCIQIRTDHIKPEKVPTVLTGCCFKVGI